MKAMILSHGGVGAPDDWSDACVTANELAWPLIEQGKVLEAVVEACRSLEDDGRTNAGMGSNLRLDGHCEMDAAVMTGDGDYAGVACITGVRNPILVAQAVLDTPHCLLAGDGANEFARLRGFEPRPNLNEKSLKRLLKWHEKWGQESLAELWRKPESMKDMSGTVGAVARADGRFAVSCSTGGAAPMLRGRVGDSPIIGAGLFAGPKGAVCCTGIGEEILRRMVAHRVYMAIEAGQDLAKACQQQLDQFPNDKSLGIIAVSEKQHAIVASRTMPVATKPQP